MTDQPTYRPVYKVSASRLTIWGVERRLFFLAMLMGAATFNLFYSFLAGLLMFTGLCCSHSGPLDEIRTCCASCCRHLWLAGASIQASTSRFSLRCRDGKPGGESSATIATQVRSTS